ncbi:MAG: hypothetical protein HFJ32_00880 [Clostridia bacterium]|nr:hypothetical protein [Clostridia bacterium]
MYSSNYVESDLINSYSWNTAIVFIQNYSERKKYANKNSVNSSIAFTGTVGDKVCNIYDMSSNCSEFTTEYTDLFTSSGAQPSCLTGGQAGDSGACTSYRGTCSIVYTSNRVSFRTLLYLNR